MVVVVVVVLVVLLVIRVVIVSRPMLQCIGVPVYHESKPKEVHAQNVCRYLLGGGEEFKEQLFF